VKAAERAIQEAAVSIVFHDRCESFSNSGREARTFHGSR
jgi:hypothetical protein